jgi:hypothetical protein
LKQKYDNGIRDQPIDQEIIIFGKTNNDPPQKKRNGGNNHHDAVADITCTKPKAGFQFKFLATNGAILMTIKHVIDAEFFVGIFMPEHRTTPATGTPKR